MRVSLGTGAKEVVATEPFTAVAGLALESEGTIVVADNGRGGPGDGFLARLDLRTRRVDTLVSAQTSDWKFLNGRPVVGVPEEVSFGEVGVLVPVRSWPESPVAGRWAGEFALGCSMLQESLVAVAGDRSPAAPRAARGDGGSRHSREVARMKATGVEGL